MTALIMNCVPDNQFYARAIELQLDGNFGKEPLNPDNNQPELHTFIMYRISHVIQIHYLVQASVATIIAYKQSTAVEK